MEMNKFADNSFSPQETIQKAVADIGYFNELFTKEEISSIESNLLLLEKSFLENDDLPSIKNKAPDEDIWNSIIDRIPIESRKWRECPPLVAESYFARKVSDIFDYYRVGIDPFEMRKMSLLFASYPLIEEVCASWWDVRTEDHSKSKLLFYALHTALWAGEMERNPAKTPVPEEGFMTEYSSQNGDDIEEPPSSPVRVSSTPHPTYPKPLEILIPLESSEVDDVSPDDIAPTPMSTRRLYSFPRDDGLLSPERTESGNEFPPIALTVESLVDVAYKRVLDNDTREAVKYILKRRQEAPAIQVPLAFTPTPSVTRSTSGTLTSELVQRRFGTTLNDGETTDVVPPQTPTTTRRRPSFNIFGSAAKQIPAPNTTGNVPVRRFSTDLQNTPLRRSSTGMYHLDGVNGPLTAARGYKHNVGIVLETTGYPLVCSLLIGHALLTTDTAAKVTFHVGSHPNGMGGVTSQDVSNTLMHLQAAVGSIGHMALLLQSYLENGLFEIREDIFWTLPTGFSHIPSDLQYSLGDSSLTIFTGPLSYRRLLDDRVWPAAMPFTNVMDAQLSSIFPLACHIIHHSAVLVLHVFTTADRGVSCGISQQKLDVVNAKDVGWRSKGEWAVVQFCPQYRDDTIKIARHDSTIKVTSISSLPRDASAFNILQTTTRVQFEEAKLEIVAVLLGQRVYHISWTIYIVGLTLIGGVLLHVTGIGSNAFVDAWFMATSATVNGGLSVVSMERISKSGLVILQFLMVLGSSSFMLLPLMLYRCHCLGRYWKVMTEILSSDKMSTREKSIVRDHQTLYRASLLTAGVVITYIVTVIVIGFLIIWISLLYYEEEPALVERGINDAQNAAFLAISSFTNSGLTISQYGLSYMTNNSVVLAVMGALILCGNIFLPVILRMILEALYLLSQRRVFLSNMDDALAYALAHPRKICTQLFNAANTNYLWQIAIIISGCEYAAFLARSIHQDSLAYVGSDRKIAGLALFQILNTRHAGFAIFTFRDLTQETLFLCVLLMFLSPVPYIGMLHTTKKDDKPENVDEENKEDDQLPPVLTVMKKIVLRVWLLRFIVVFLMAAATNSYIINQPEEVNMWYVIFEMVSAFGLVGLSIGVPGENYSLSGKFNIWGKLLMILTFYLGKNRSMPEVDDEVIDFEFLQLREVLLRFEDVIGRQLTETGDDPVKSSRRSKQKRSYVSMQTVDEL